MVLVLLLIGIFAFIIGYFLGRSTAKPSENPTEIQTSLKILTNQINELSRQQGAVSSSLGMLNSLSNLITDFKARYEEMKETERKLTTERDKRLEEFMNSMKRAFEDVSNKTLKIDEEKEKRIVELVERMRQFADEQRASTERFLIQQGQTREEIEKRRDAELKDMRRIMEDFVYTVSGTKTRGMVGEMLLSEALSESIKIGTVVKNLPIGSMVVEFAWSLGDGKYIPIDSKLPDLAELINEYQSTEEKNEKEQKKKKLISKMEKEIENVKRYSNQPNTIDSCILVVPSLVLDIAPELAASAKKQNVFLCTYKEIFAVAHYLEARYLTMKKDESGNYKQLIQILVNILEQIENKCSTLDRALKSISNASDEIKNLIVKAKSSANSDLVKHEEET